MVGCGAVEELVEEVIDDDHACLQQYCSDSEEDDEPDERLDVVSAHRHIVCSCGQAHCIELLHCG